MRRYKYPERPCRCRKGFTCIKCKDRAKSIDDTVIMIVFLFKAAFYLAVLAIGIPTGLAFAAWVYLPRRRRRVEPQVIASVDTTRWDALDRARA